MTFLLMIACSGAPEPETPVEPAEAEPQVDPLAKELLPKAQGSFKALPERMDGETPATQPQIDLGRQLYYDARLSKNQDVSCNSCHQLDGYGVDGEPTSPGHKGQRGDRNSPTSFNAAVHIAQFWDGRAATVEEQAKGPVLNPVEMAMPDEASVVAVLKSIPEYETAFKAAFPDAEDPITYDNMAAAIGAFERGLVTPAPIDAYLGGDLAALSTEELKGMQTFLEVGCQTCHMGVAIGGTQYRKLGERVPFETEDKGLGALKGDPNQDFMFKVPSLRNIEKTGPYFHDGSVATLSEAVTLMGKHQLDVELSEQQVSEITTFLGALTGSVDAEYCKQPEAFASGEKTPAPDPS